MTELPSHVYYRLIIFIYLSNQFSRINYLFSGKQKELEDHLSKQKCSILAILGSITKEQHLKWEIY